MSEKTVAEQQAKAVFTAPSIMYGQYAAVSAANGPIVLTIPPPGDTSTPRPRNTLTYVHWSYDDDPTGGTLTITDGTVTEIIHITNGGPGFLPFEGVAFAENAAVTFTLSAGGGTVIGALALIGVRSF